VLAQPSANAALINVKDSGISNSVIQDSQPHFTDTNDIPYSDLE